MCCRGPALLLAMAHPLTYIVMAYVVMAYIVSYGLYRYGLYVVMAYM